MVSQRGGTWGRISKVLVLATLAITSINLRLRHFGDLLLLLIPLVVCCVLHQVRYSNCQLRVSEEEFPYTTKGSLRPCIYCLPFQQSLQFFDWERLLRYCTLLPASSFLLVVSNPVFWKLLVRIRLLLCLRIHFFYLICWPTPLLSNVYVRVRLWKYTTENNLKKNINIERIDWTTEGSDSMNKINNWMNEWMNVCMR